MSAASHKTKPPKASHNEPVKWARQERKVTRYLVGPSTSMANNPDQVLNFPPKHDFSSMKWSMPSAFKTQLFAVEKKRGG
jgi:hypothetical protein